VAEGGGGKEWLRIEVERAEIGREKAKKGRGEGGEKKHGEGREMEKE